jgi:hypothetical protein
MWLQALASNPITILAVSVLILVWIGKGSMEALIDNVTKLVESTTKNAENVDRLETLLREQVVEQGKTVSRVEQKTNGLETYLIRIENLVKELLADCRKDKQINE